MGAHPDSDSCRRGAHPRHRSTYRVDPASSISFATNRPFPPSSKLCPVSWGRVVLGGSGGQGCTVFISTWNKIVFLLYHFLSLVFMHFSICIWECVGKPRSPGKRSHSYRSLGLGKGAQKIIPCSHSQTWALQLGPSKEL